MELTAKLLAYWQSAEQMIRHFHQPISHGHVITQDACNAGQVTQEIVEQIFALAKADPTALSIPIIVSPITITKSAAGDNNSAHSRMVLQATNLPRLTLFCLYAELTRDGQIFANSTYPLPWVARTLTEPSANLDFCLGNVDDFDHYYNYSPPAWEDGAPSWQQQLAYGYQFFHDVTKGNWQLTMRQLGYDPSTLVTITPILSSTQAALQQENLAAKKINSIYNKIFDPNKCIAREPVSAPKIYQTSGQHFAHSFSKYALSLPQRRILTQALLLAKNEIMFVEACYGTGKTTIIYDFIATKWVHAIIEGKKPPTIALVGKDSLVHRVTILDCQTGGNNWLAQSSVASFYQPEQSDDLPKSKLIANFLTLCGKEFGRDVDNLATAKNLLRERLMLLQTNLQQGIQAACSYHALTKQIELSYRTYGGIVRRHKDIKDTNEKQTSLLNYLTVMQGLFIRQLTPRSFWSKWLELFWPFKQKKTEKMRAFFAKHMPDEDIHDLSIVQMQEYLQTLQVKAHKKQHALADMLLQIETDLQQLSIAKARAKLLVPDKIEEDFELAKLMKFFDTHLRYRIFLTALHYWEAELLQKANWDADDIFAAYYQTKPTPLSELTQHPVDWLLIENANYLSPLEGFFCLEGSSHLIVMGDRDLITPNRLPFAIDLQLVTQHELLADSYEHDIDELQDKGLLMATGEFGTIIQQIADYQGAEYTLNKQWDVASKIIECSNQLPMLKKLQPCKKINPSFMEEFCYQQVLGQKELYQASFRNDLEIVGIINWLKLHEAAILARYPECSLRDAVLVVTTFYSQSLALRQAFIDANLEVSNIVLLQNMHKQRAPIVLFSPVYSQADKGKLCFDQGSQVLRNLLLSAQEHLLVFGDKAIFNQNLHSPAGILAKFLFSAEKNELVPG